MGRIVQTYFNIFFKTSRVLFLKAGYFVLIFTKVPYHFFTLVMLLLRKFLADFFYAVTQ